MRKTETKRRGCAQTWKIESESTGCKTPTHVCKRPKDVPHTVHVCQCRACVAGVEKL